MTYVNWNKIYKEGMRLKAVKISVLSALVITAIIITVGLLYIMSVHVNPMIANDLAMLQMQNTEDSSFWIQNYSMWVNMSNSLPGILLVVWLVPIITGIVMFRKDFRSKPSEDEI